MFDLLSDPRRLSLLAELLAGERNVGELAAATGASESGTSHALRLLRAHRVVAVRRDGRQAYYRLTDDHVRQLLDVALAHVEHATRCTTPGAVTGERPDPGRAVPPARRRRGAEPADRGRSGRRRPARRLARPAGRRRAQPGRLARGRPGRSSPCACRSARRPAAPRSADCAGRSWPRRPTRRPCSSSPCGSPSRPSAAWPIPSRSPAPWCSWSRRRGRPGQRRRRRAGPRARRRPEHAGRRRCTSPPTPRSRSPWPRRGRSSGPSAGGTASTRPCPSSSRCSSAPGRPPPAAVVRGAARGPSGRPRRRGRPGPADRAARASSGSTTSTSGACPTGCTRRRCTSASRAIRR